PIFLDRRQAADAPPLHARRPADHRGLLPGGLRVLPARRDRLRYRGGLSGGPCVAPAPGGPARLEAPLRADAGGELAAGAGEHGESYRPVVSTRRPRAVRFSIWRS